MPCLLRPQQSGPQKGFHLKDTLEWKVQEAEAALEPKGSTTASELQEAKTALELQEPAKTE